MSTPAQSPAVVAVPEQNRFEIQLDGKAVGLVKYVDGDSQRVFVHTEVDEAYSGQGLAGTLVGGALDATRAAGLRVIPVCPYVEKFVGKHHDWDDLLDPVTPQAQRAAEAVLDG